MGGRPALMQRFPEGRRRAVVLPEAGAQGRPDWLQTDDREHAERHDVARARRRRPRPRRVGGEPRLPRLPRLAVPRRRPRATPTSCASTSIRSPASTSTQVREAARRGAGAARRARASSATRRRPATGAARLRAARARDGTRTRCGAAAVAIARELERRRPDLITAAWWKEERGDAGVRRLQPERARTRPCSAPGRCGPGRARRCRRRRVGRGRRDPPRRADARRVPGRVAGRRRPVGGHDDDPQSLEPLLAMHERDRAAGLMDAPWPPVYPKQPDEPPRVAPSRARRTCT